LVGKVKPEGRPREGAIYHNKVMGEGGAKCESGNAPHSKDLTCIKTMVVWQQESEVSFNFL